MDKYVCDAQNAPKISKWLKERGGILIWPSVNLCDLGKSWTTPALNEDGTPAGKPTWQAGDKPRHITDPADVEVYQAREVKRFHVATRMGAQGLSVKVTDGGSRRIRREVAKAEEEYGKHAWHEFDYGDYENAIILVEDEKLPLVEWERRQREVDLNEVEAGKPHWLKK